MAPGARHGCSWEACRILAFCGGVVELQQRGRENSRNLLAPRRPTKPLARLRRLYSLLSVPSFRENAKASGLEATLRSIHAQAADSADSKKRVGWACEARRQCSGAQWRPCFAGSTCLGVRVPFKLSQQRRVPVFCFNCFPPWPLSIRELGMSYK